MSLWLALLLGAWGAALGLAGAFTSRADLSQSGARGVHAATLFTALSAVGLGWALAVGDLTYRYVASWASYMTPLPYRLGALWAGPSGALLLWALALGVGATLAPASLPRASALRAWTAALLAVLLVAVIALACLDTSPFMRLPFPPEDGRILPLEWMRPIVLVQMPVGYIAMALVAVPAVLTVMGAIGTAEWRTVARRWALACWALLGAAMLLDWRRRYGDGAWAGDWRWAPVQAGTAWAWAGASLLVLASGRRWRADASAIAGFVAFTLGLVGVTMRRAGGWDGVHAFGASAAGQALAWGALAAVVVVSVAGLAASRAARGLAAQASRITHGALLVGSAALVAAGLASSSDIALREGARADVRDRFGTPWSLSLDGVSRVGREAVIADLVAVRAAVKGRGRAFVTPEVRSIYLGDSQEPSDQMLVSGIAAGLAQDLRVDVRQSGTADAVLTVQFVPAVTWIWIAGIVAVLAAFVSAFTRVGAAHSPDDAPAPDATGAAEEGA